MFFFLLVILLTSTFAEFNMTTCPGWWEMQAPNVLSDFDVNKLPGNYYELLFHDYTQYPSCPKPECIMARKSIANSGTTIMDGFLLKCYGKFYAIDLRFNLTGINGFFNGWAVIGGRELDMNWPDTLVAFAEDPADPNQYKWVIEIQCKQHLHKVTFTGINFYSKYWDVDQSYIDEMRAAANASGIDYYMNQNIGITYPHQGADCDYPINDTNIPNYFDVFPQDYEYFLRNFGKN